jgi:PAS domain-containing protein
MARWPGNAGSEAMARLRDGRFLVFSEGHVREADGTSPVLLFPADPALLASMPVALRYRPPAGYVVTDAAALPDGRILFLNRRWALLDGFSAVLTITDAPKLEEGATLEGRELAVLAAPLTVDNLEALSATREGGRTILWIASDDNFNPLLQQTLLLKFALRD